MSDKSVAIPLRTKEAVRIPGSWRWLIVLAIVYLAWLIWLLFVGWYHSAK